MPICEEIEGKESGDCCSESATSCSPTCCRSCIKTTATASEPSVAPSSPLSTHRHEEAAVLSQQEKSAVEEESPDEQKQNMGPINISGQSLAYRQQSRPPSLSVHENTDTIDQNVLYCHSQQQRSTLQNDQFCLPPSLVTSPPSIFGSLDPNAREFTPAASSASAANLQQPILQAVRSFNPSPNPEMVSLNYKMGATIFEMGPANSANYELGHANYGLGHPKYYEMGPANYEMGAVNYEIGAAGYEMGPANYEMNRQIPYTGEVGFAYNEGAGYGGYAGGAPQMGIGIPAAPVGANLPAFRPPILANPSPARVGLFPAMAMGPPAPPPLPAASSRPYLCSPAAAEMDPLVSNVFIHKQFHHQYGWKEHISRALLITGVPAHLSEIQLREELQCWGPIRAMQVERLPEGLLSVQFYDLRSSQQALRDMQNQHLLRQQQFQQQLHAQNGTEFPYRLHLGAHENGSISSGPGGLLCGNVVWAQYIAAWAMPVPDVHNQGTLVLFNVGTDVNLQDLREVFETYGDVRELREAPTKRQHKFVEFYDVRDAAAAWTALNGQEVCGKCVKIEFSRQGGPARRQKAQARAHQEMAAAGNIGTMVAHGHIAQPHGWNKDTIHHGWQGHNGSHQQEWQRLPSEGQSPPFHVTLSTASGPDTIVLANTLKGPNDASKHGLPRFHGYGNERKTGFNGFRSGEIAGPWRRRNGISSSDPKAGQVVVKQSHSGGADGSCELERYGAIPRHPIIRGGHLHFEFDEREVYLISGNQRTTLMIRNIPNKYSQQMLLSLLDQHCLEYNSQIVDINEPESAYDFVYLPIDFKNRCNLGYAFVNFTTALATLKFYKAFHEQAWEAFNSRKICEIAYARVQGRSALEDHFRNSRFACDTDEYLPLVFVPPRNGIECPSPRVAAAQLGMIRGGRTVGGGRALLLPAGRTLTSSGGQTPAALLKPCKPPSGSGLPHDKAFSDCNSNSSGSSSSSSSGSANGDHTAEGDVDDVDGLDMPTLKVGADTHICHIPP